MSMAMGTIGAKFAGGICSEVSIIMMQMQCRTTCASNTNRVYTKYGHETQIVEDRETQLVNMASITG